MKVVYLGPTEPHTLDKGKEYEINRIHNGC